MEGNRQVPGVAKGGGNAAQAGNASSAEKSFQVQAPSVSLPKGGGAIRGMGEKFAANPVTGTGSMTVPIATSPGRSGFGPQLSLSYDSGAGNGPFGLGWNLSQPCITRKTDSPPVRDQGDVDCCAAMAVVTAMEIVDRQAAPARRLSVLYNYYMARGGAPGGGMPPVLRGLTFREALQAALMGVSPEQYHEKLFVGARGQGSSFNNLQIG